jgi:hypothetical protein
MFNPHKYNAHVKSVPDSQTLGIERDDFDEEDNSGRIFEGVIKKIKYKVILYESNANKI